MNYTTTRPLNRSTITYSRIDSSSRGLPEIDHVIFNEPATIVFFKDGSKTVVKAQNHEPFDPEKGIAMAIAKRAYGNSGRYFDQIKPWSKDYQNVIAKLYRNFLTYLVGCRERDSDK